MGLLQLLFPKHEEYYSSTHSVAYPMHIKMKKKKKKKTTLPLVSHNSLYAHHVLHATSQIVTLSLLPEISAHSQTPLLQSSHTHFYHLLHVICEREDIEERQRTRLRETMTVLFRPRERD
jgi:hypothetical protein